MVDESTRRLPNWMLGASVTADIDKKKKEEKRHSDDTTEPEEEGEKRNLAKNSKLEAKGRKSNQDTDNKELNAGFDNVINKKTTNRLGRKRKAKSKAEIKAEEEEAELTVEDLVSIAEEYVEADEDSRRKQASIRECKLQRQLQTTASSKNDLEESLIVPDDKHISASCETTASYSSTMNLVGEQSLISTTRAGDPAHDMLDLFLGPLLKKPMEKEKSTEFIAKDMDFTYELKKKSQNDVGEEMVPPMVKKKSSLKDKNIGSKLSRKIRHVNIPGTMRFHDKHKIACHLKFQALGNPTSLIPNATSECIGVWHKDFLEGYWQIECECTLNDWLQIELRDRAF
ncbi:unnamed protein product [Dovyalis caffra]|uniref:Uncharacterized protein n=1 Tax=Dovyalis caffra TaxID=77055 RepID=A0AAV1R0N6_9ROSI|nr:unnamed protein product [Dovyalis caffra]